MAACLKGAGTVVTLLVEYQPNEYKELQQKLQKLKVAREAVMLMKDIVLCFQIQVPHCSGGGIQCYRLL